MIETCSLTTRRAAKRFKSHRYGGECLAEYAVVHQLFINESCCLGNALRWEENMKMSDLSLCESNVLHPFGVCEGTL